MSAPKHDIFAYHNLSQVNVQNVDRFSASQHLDFLTAQLNSLKHDPEEDGRELDAIIALASSIDVKPGNTKFGDITKDQCEALSDSCLDILSRLRIPGDSVVGEILFGIANSALDAFMLRTNNNRTITYA